MTHRLKKLAVASLTVFVLTVAATTASAQTIPPPPASTTGNRPMARLLRTPYRPLVMEMRGVRLTPDQRQQVRSIFETHRPELKAVQEKLRAARAQWRQAGKIDIAQRKSLTEERLARLQAVRTEILDILTPEQKAQVEANRARRRLY